jgi:hypothetical protein
VSEFTLWFIRPIAEFLGAVSLMIVILALCGIVFLGFAAWEWCAKKIESWRKP